MTKHGFFLEALCLLAVFAFLTGASGCSKKCSVGHSKCVTDTMIRTCVKDEHGDPIWFTYPCVTGTTCVKAEKQAQEAGDSGLAKTVGALDVADGSVSGDAAAKADAAGAEPDAGSKKSLDAGAKKAADAGASAADAGASAADAGASAAKGDRCEGICQDGAARCVTKEMSSYCVNGTEWKLDPCEVGESCDSKDGRCKISNQDTVKACEPDAKACVSDKWEKVCDPDGSGWRLTQCRDFEICNSKSGQCETDPNQSCDPTGGFDVVHGYNTGFCLDSKTSVRCSSNTGGYVTVVCTGDTYCADGGCRGANCFVGSNCVGAPTPLADNPAASLPTQILECTDGVNQKLSECAIGQVCRQNGDQAECVNPACKLGAMVCGDPDDAKVDATKYFSACVKGANSGVPEWVLTECTGNLVCDPSAADAGDLCRSECTPKAQVCTADAATGVVNGWRECQGDGTWGPITNCNSGAKGQLICMDKLNQDPGALNQVICAQPVCADVAAHTPATPSASGVMPLQGVCDGAKIRTCDENGVLSDDSVACEIGVCRNVGTVQSDGQIRGACDEETDCEKGEGICLAAGDGPLYQTCVDGKWGTELLRCSSDKTCWNSVDADGLRHQVCGGECGPGMTRCDPKDLTGTKLQICNTDGTWGDSTTCSYGLCVLVSAEDPTGAMATRATCSLRCEPGKVYCDPSSGAKTADDGLNQGWAGTRTCKPKGYFPDPTDSSDDSYFKTCSGDTACRVSSAGEHTGCIECLGPTVPGGNTYGFADTKCDGNDFVSCGDSNKWATGRACGSGTTCMSPHPPLSICGDCVPGNGVGTVECTETNVNNTQICGTCTSDLGNTVTCTETNRNDDDTCIDCSNADYQLVQCTNTNIGQHCADCLMPNGTVTTTCTDTNIADNGGTDCASNGHGTGSGPWGGYADCCNDAASRASSGETCASMYYGAPSAWGGQPDCCANYGAHKFPCPSGFGPWGGEAECCFGYHNGYTSTCTSLGYGGSGSYPGWTGDPECCVDYRNYTPAQDYAVCL